MTNRSLLARLMPDSATPPEQIRAMAAAAYHKRNAVLILLDDPRLTDWERQFAENVGSKLYGRRECAPR